MFWTVSVLFKFSPLFQMASNYEPPQDEDASELQFPKEFENAETLLISEVTWPFLSSIRKKIVLVSRIGFLIDVLYVAATRQKSWKITILPDVSLLWTFEISVFWKWRIEPRGYWLMSLHMFTYSGLQIPMFPTEIPNCEMNNWMTF